MAILNYALTNDERLSDGDAARVLVRAGAALTAGQRIAITNGIATFSQSGTYFAPASVRAGDVFWAAYPLGSMQPAALPANTVLPAITGTTTVGQTLTASNGTWTGSPTSYAYQWRRDGAPISGATASTYLLDAADETADISVTVTATSAFGSTSATSTEVGPVAGA